MKKRVLTNKQIVAMWNGLNQIAQLEQSVGFGYVVARNMAKLRPIIETLEKSIAPIPEYVDAHRKLLLEWSEKREDGSPVVINGQHSIPDMAGFNEAIAKLKHQTSQDRHEEDVEKLMMSKEEIDVLTVPFSLLPENIKPGLLEVVLPMIDDPPTGAVVELAEAASAK